MWAVVTADGRRSLVLGDGEAKLGRRFDDVFWTRLETNRVAPTPLPSGGVNRGLLTSRGPEEWRVADLDVSRFPVDAGVVLDRVLRDQIRARGCESL